MRETIEEIVQAFEDFKKKAEIILEIAPEESDTGEKGEGSPFQPHGESSDDNPP